jgi:hypothetical protein
VLCCAVPCCAREIICTGDKQYQEQVLIELASKAGQVAVQPPHHQQQQQQQGDGQQPASSSSAPEALMAQAQQLAASYGADPFQLELWFVHSLVLYAPDISQPEAQSMLAAHTQQLLQANPAAAAAHLYHHTYPLLPAAAAAQCACVLGLIHSALQAFCTQQQQQQGERNSAGAPAAASASSIPAAVTVALAQLEKMRELLVKSSKALSGLAAKALIGGHVSLMVGPAVAAAAAMAAAADPSTVPPAAAGEQEGGPEAAAAAGADAPQDGSQEPSKRLEAASAAAAAAVAAVDLQMVLLEASSAVSAFVSTPGQAGVAAKFNRHLNTLAEAHARASVGDKPKQQALQKLAQGVSPGLPHLLLFMRSMTSGAAEIAQQQQQQQYWADAEDAKSDGLNRAGSGESFQSAISVSSSQMSGRDAAHPGHNPAAAMAIEWATARARYAGSSGRQQLLNCSALQLAGVAGWLALSQPQPVSADAIGQLQPLAMGPGLQLQLLTDVITLITNPEAQLPGMVTGARRVSSGGSSRGSSFHQSSSTAEQAAATAVAAAAALSAAAAAAGGVPVGGLTPLMRDDPAAIAGWQPPSLPANLAPKRRELVAPLLQAASQIVAKNLILSAVAAGGAVGAAAEAAVEDVALLVSQAGAAAEPGEQQQQGVAQSACMLELLRALISAGSFSAVGALQLTFQLAALQLSVAQAMGQQQQQQEPAADGGADSGSSSSSSTVVKIARQQAEQAVSSVLQQLTQAALQGVQQQLAAEQGEASTDGSGASDRSPLHALQLLVGCLEQDASAGPTNSPTAAVPTAATAGAAAEDSDAADSAAGAGGSSSSSSGWLAASIQQLQTQLWDALQQHQAQLPAEAYSSSLVAELLELQETVGSGSTWPGWSSAGTDSAGAAAAAGAAGGAAAAAGDAAGGKPKSSGTGLLLARTMTALSKQFPGVKVSRWTAVGGLLTWAGLPVCLACWLCYYVLVCKQAAGLCAVPVPAHADPALCFVSCLSHACCCCCHTGICRGCVQC